MLPDIVQRALRFAKHAHSGQQRKYTGAPYIVHPVEVRELLLLWYPQATLEQQVAALLHDVVEDCDVTLQDITTHFGESVATLVEGLTDVSQLSDGPRHVRKALDRAHTAGAHPDAQLVKCADIISNATSILEHDPNFAIVFTRECALMLDVMDDSVKQTEIWQEAKRCLIRKPISDANCA